ncbi:MAG: hypothetical protein J3K34DRAFT_419577 [Monoraphidium minutum]|nr:MAG: hypothetical protein J3K34DRAFT_419577 [Monoraphidium minutum]
MNPQTANAWRQLLRLILWRFASRAPCPQLAGGAAPAHLLFCARTTFQGRRRSEAHLCVARLWQRGCMRGSAPGRLRTHLLFPPPHFRVV